MSLNDDKSLFVLAATGESFITLRLAVHNEKRFKEMIKILRDADISFTNLETLIHDYEGYPIAKQKPGTYPRAPPIVANDLRWAGINMVSQANNHSLDYSYEGMFITSKHLENVGIAHAGTGKDLEDARAPVYVDTKKARVALIATTTSSYKYSTYDWWRAGSSRAGIKGRPGINPLRYKTRYVVKAETIENLKKLVKELDIYSRVSESEIEFLGSRFIEGDKPGVYTTCFKPDLEGTLISVKDARRQADLVFVSIHSHEYDRNVEIPAQFVRKFSKDCIDAGADAILGHGPHMLRGIEIYKGKPIFYSLGNFIFQNQQVERLPQGEYELVDLDINATPGDYFDIREYGSETIEFPISKWYSGDMRYWQGVIAHTNFKIESRSPPVQGQPPRSGSKLTEIKLYPVTLQYMKPRSQRGRPILAAVQETKKIIEHLRKLSAPFGTEIVHKNGDYIVKIE